MSTRHNPLFSVGHSNHSPKRLLWLLQKHGVSEVADVRSSPYSHYNSQFNREALEEFLEERNIRYVFLGRELGGRPPDPSCYDDTGRVQYDRVAQTDQFFFGIQQLIRDVDEHHIALMCAEKDPLECHRTLLVAHSLTKHGIDGNNIQHILSDGRLKSHTDTMTRLLDTVKIRQLDLFAPPDELDALIEKAIQQQAGKVAYVSQQSHANRNYEEWLV